MNVISLPCKQIVRGSSQEEMVELGELWIWWRDLWAGKGRRLLWLLGLDERAN